VHPTINAEVNQAMFEQALLTADSAAELQEIKARFPEKLRRKTMGDWLKDGRYEWLTRKYEVLYSNPQEGALKFWQHKPATWPKVGELVRQSGSTTNNKPLKVLAVDDGKLRLEAMDGSQWEPAPIECFSYWPAQGDRVTFLIREYLGWLRQVWVVNQANTAIAQQIMKRLEKYGAQDGHVGGDVVALLKSYELVTVQDAMGAVDMGGKVQVPLRCLIVVNKDN
jgi:hypothetical protein